MGIQNGRRRLRRSRSRENAPKSDEPCRHGLEPETCSICNEPDTVRASQTTLSIRAIDEAVNLLADDGDFRPKDVANHPAVQPAHPDVRDDPRFDQHICMYLTEAVGRLRTEQVSPKSRSNAIWRRRA